MKALVILLALSLLHVCSSVPVSRPTNWLRKCRASTNLSITALEVLPILLPPFTNPPLVRMQTTNTVMVMTEDDKTWVRVGKTKAWNLAKPEEIREMVRKLNPERSQMSSGEKSGVAFGVMGLIALVVKVVIVLVKKRRRVSGFTRARGYEEIFEEVECEEEETETMYA